MVHLILVSIVVLAIIGAKPQYRPFNGFAFIALFVFAALRYDFGNDYMNYYDHFMDIKFTGINPFDTEILYVALNKYSPSFFFMVALMSAVFVYTLWKLVKRNVDPELVWVSVLILLINPYLFLINLSAMRQTMAIVLFIIAVYFSKNKMPIVYCALIGTAALFHKSAIMLLPMYFWADKKRVSILGCVCILIGILVLMFSPTALISILENVVDSFDSKNYQAYLAEGAQNTIRATLLTSITLVYLLINLPFLDGETLLYSKLLLVGIALNVLAYRLSNLTRIEMYFDIYAIAAIPMMMKNGYMRAKRHSKLYCFINILVLPCLIFFVYILRYYSFFTNPTWSSFGTYRTILSQIGF